jgi:hypothetical protein
MIDHHFYTQFANQELQWTPGDSWEKFRDNVSKNYSKVEEHGWLTRTFTYKHNSHGFRCEEFDDSPSIVTLGCSHAYGTGLPLETTWSQILAKKLDLTCFNLGVPASANDTMFRLASIYLEKIKPKLVVLWDIDPARFEVILDDRSYTFLPNKNHTFSPKDSNYTEMTKVHSWYNLWIAHDDNPELNKRKNIAGIQTICTQLGIKFWCKQHNPGDILSMPGLARDLMHPGIETNANIANYIAERL